MRWLHVRLTEHDSGQKRCASQHFLGARNDNAEIWKVPNVKCNKLMENSAINRVLPFLSPIYNSVMHNERNAQWCNLQDPRTQNRRHRVSCSGTTRVTTTTSKRRRPMARVATLRVRSSTIKQHTVCTIHAIFLHFLAIIFHRHYYCGQMEFLLHLNA